MTIAITDNTLIAAKKGGKAVDDTENYCRTVENTKDKTTCWSLLNAISKKKIVRCSIAVFEAFNRVCRIQ